MTQHFHVAPEEIERAVEQMKAGMAAGTLDGEPTNLCYARLATPIMEHFIRWHTGEVNAGTPEEIGVQAHLTLAAWMLAQACAQAGPEDRGKVLSLVLGHCGRAAAQFIAGERFYSAHGMAAGVA